MIEEGGIAAAAGTDAHRGREIPEFLEFLVVGGATLFLFPLSWIARKALGLDAAEYSIGFLTFYGAYFVNDPHFAVTYLLFYKDVKRRTFGREVPWAQRVRYVASGIIVPGVLILWMATSLGRRSAEGLGWMVQAMYLLVGWHYAKQGFGIFAVLAARRGIAISLLERRTLLFHAYAGWAYAWASPASPGGEFEEKGVVYHALPHPRAMEVGAGGIFVVSTLLVAAAIVARVRRDAASPDDTRNRSLGALLPALTPLTGFLVSIWSWTIYSSVDPLVRYAIPALHSIQYLYFVWLMKRNQAREAEGPPTFGRPAGVQVGMLAIAALGLGWLLLRAAPSLLDGLFAGLSVGTRRPGVRLDAADPALGPTPWFAGLFVAVNIHHYFMDHVIWRRDNPDTRYLRDARAER